MKPGDCVGCFSDTQPVDPGVAYVNGFVTALTIAAMEPLQITLHIGALCERHRMIAAAVMSVIARRGNIAVEVITKKFEAAYMPKTN